MNENLYIVAALISLAIFIIGFAAFYVSFRNRNSFKKSLIMYFLPLLVISILLIRFVYVDYVNDFSQGFLGVWEKLMDVLFYTVFAFTIESDNVMIVSDLRGLFENIIQFDFLGDLIKAYISLLNIIAPVVGCAIILDLICGLFPKLRIGLEGQRDKYIFSELNEKTICLAQDIRNKKGKSVSVIFTKVLHQDNETEMQLLKKAKLIDAICLKESITQTKLPGKKNVNYILLNDELVDNIDLMTEIIGAYKSLCGRAAEKSIVLFAQDEYVDDIVDKIHESKDLADDNLSIKVVREYTNLAYDLLLENPLYKYVDEEKGAFDVLLVGCADVGREMLLATYWCGQFGNLASGWQKIPLRIHVVDKDAKIIKSELQANFPEIAFDGEENGYCNFSFYECDVTGNEFSELLGIDGVLNKADYVVVSLGNDLLNFKISQMIGRKLYRVYVDSKPYSINYIVKDDSMKMHMANYFDAETCRSFGNISDRYSLQNVFSSRIYEMAKIVNDTYHQGEDLKEVRRKFARDSYGIKSSSATGVHAWYKIYSINALGKSSDEINELVDENIDYLGWLEHQRWVAYMRSMGYVRASKEDIERVKQTKDRKNRVHGCLVESEPGINIKSEDWGKEEIESYDELDNFSLWFYNITSKKVDYKTYDYKQVKMITEKLMGESK